MTSSSESRDSPLRSYPIVGDLVLLLHQHRRRVGCRECAKATHARLLIPTSSASLRSASTHGCSHRFQFVNCSVHLSTNSKLPPGRAGRADAARSSSRAPLRRHGPPFRLGRRSSPTRRAAAAAAPGPRSHGARSHASYSSVVVRSTGIAFGCTGPTTPLACVVRKPKELVRAVNRLGPWCRARLATASRSRRRRTAAG